ncbi:hypothetical protein MRX96_032044 [Rhipicephalus microplus]
MYPLFQQDREPTLNSRSLSPHYWHIFSGISMSVFSLRVVIKNLQDSREDEDDLDMDSYIAAYRELSK